ncbi:hypothetical protein, variant [Cladophialophora immunda]|uniref:Subtelomeric hrmA-associated cluster protein AFUB-079030/YDR124W-like helical bundle domain-containing protein n=1 Tax=Cladophialophora immunda TaxID=569365 RepID=A0A0D2AQG8_9EURO|nr:uncharacterized protein PV07_07091 [Cladophialophora immunda]XP_016247563.1 hypothetical protein, variant [Cladophialophora immunda]KIW27346.1 hypothetical protein PV07_07091 [Cladophialophora immunda]KIW27347.1 hypothetical protein, variant [Cladophialophora immunda]OQV10341.1 hypothetical protein CLAIMM_14358 isoform 1 [Cladophialophora immunda]OQV10342.1 hypothetical protein CLAIMM_14358 isoform 2 [Cladophialophora immunda]
MTSEVNFKSSPQSPTDKLSTTPQEDPKTLGAAVSGLTKEAKQQYLINEIKKLVEDCEDFIGLVPGPHGVPEVVVSPNIKKDRWAIIGESHGTFAQYLSMRSPSAPAHCCGANHQNAKPSKPEPVADAVTAGGAITWPAQRPLKRHRSKTNICSRNTSRSRPQQSGGGARLWEAPASQIRVDDHEKLAHWYREAFLILQQVACRLVAKVWIKRLHPKKQSTHPYNGQMPRGEPPDPDRTRPPYWPADVIHREPDHIGRDDRTRLLVHLITNTPQPVITNPPSDGANQQFVRARDLLESLQTKRSELREDRWDIIQQIVNAREKQEQYEANEIDGDTLVFVCDYGDGTSSKLSAIDSDDDGLRRAGSALGASSDGSIDAGEEHEPTPGSSTQTSPNDQTATDARLLSNKARTSGFKEASSRRYAPRRPRQSFNSARVVSVIAPRTGQEFSPGVKMGMEDGTTLTDGVMLPIAGIHQVPPSVFARNIDSHAGTNAMIHAAAHSGHLTTDLHSSTWSGMLPDMGPDPPPEMFGIPSNMAPHPVGLRHGYFAQESLEMANGIQSGLAPTVVNPMLYHDFGDNARRSLPLRVAETQQAAMIPTPDISMEMMADRCYKLDHW